MSKNVKTRARLKRKGHIRKTLTGTPARPRMSVFRSLRHIYVQVIDDTTGRTLVSASSRETEVAEGADELKKADLDAAFDLQPHFKDVNRTFKAVGL